MSAKEALLDSYYMDEALQPIAARLGVRAGPAAVELIARRFEECVGSPADDRYSYVWRAAIEPHEQDAHKDGIKPVLIDVLRDAALGMVRDLDDERRACIERLLNSDYHTLRRVGIYVCAERFGDLQSVFWDAFRDQWLGEHSLWHELYWLIKKNFRAFSAPGRNKFVAAVRHLTGDWRDPSQQEMYDEMLRRDVLAPAAGQGDPEVDSLFQELVSRRGEVRDHSDFYTYSTGGIVVEKSPTTSDEILRISGGELRDRMVAFKPDARDWEGPSYRGFAASITAAVRASDDAFASRLSLFVGVAPAFQHGLLRGLRDRWLEDKREIPWMDVLAFMNELLRTGALTTTVDESETFSPNRHWVATDLADLAKASVQGDSEKVPTAFVWGALKIVDQLLLQTVPTPVSESNDPVSTALNSTHGRALEALINLALSLKRGEADGQSELWNHLEPIFERELAQSVKGDNAEFAAFCGMYCPNVRYLNADWFSSNFNSIFPAQHTPAWGCAVRGFSYVHHFYDWLYQLLLTTGNLRRMLFEEEASTGGQVKKKAIQYCAIAYVDRLDDGPLITELIERLDSGLPHLCWFFWTMRGSLSKAPGRRERILGFWKSLHETVERRRPLDEELLSDMNSFAAFVDELTPDLTRLWRSVAPFAHVKHHGNVLVENLSRLATKHPGEVVEVYRAALERFVPDFDPDDVRACVLRLAEAGHFQEAEWICNAYAEKGSMLLKETYNQIRAEQRGASPSVQG